MPVTAVAKMGEEWKGGEFDIKVYLIYFLTVFGFWRGNIHSLAACAAASRFMSFPSDSTYYGTRFHGDDLSGKLYFTLQMMAMVGIMVNGRGRADPMIFLLNEGISTSILAGNFLSLVECKKKRAKMRGGEYWDTLLTGISSPH